jgi:hypothetical protein
LSHAHLHPCTALLALAPVLALAAGLWLGWAANNKLAQDAGLDRGGAGDGDPAGPRDFGDR